MSLQFPFLTNLWVLVFFFLHLACIHSLLNHKLVVFFFSILLADFTYWRKLLTPRPPQKKNESNGNSKTLQISNFEN